MQQGRVIFDADAKYTRKCGDCQLCCKLVPVVALKKKAHERCKYQKAGKGCAVYRRPGFPPECHAWSCRWLLQEPGTENLHRPDRAHYCLDVMPDYVTLVDPTKSEPTAVEVVQVWCDPGYPDAHRDPALRAWLDAKRMPALVRYDERKALHLFPPSCSDDHRWHEITNTTSPERQHSPAQIAAAVGVRPVATTGGEPQ